MSRCGARHAGADGPRMLRIAGSKAMITLCARRSPRARVTIALRSGQWRRVGESELRGGEQPRQLGVDAGEALLGVGGDVTGGAAEGRRGGEGALGTLGLSEARCSGRRRRARGRAGRLRRRPAWSAAAARVRALLPIPGSRGQQLRAVRVDAAPQAAVRVRLAQVGGRGSPRESQVRVKGSLRIRSSTSNVMFSCCKT